jgi:hypothetical protein
MNTTKKTYQFLDHFTLKIIACIIMTIDHIGFFFVPSGTTLFVVLRTIGRIALPLFAFLSFESVLKSHKPLIYFAKLIGLAIIMDLIQFIFNKEYSGNALTSLALGVLTIYLLNKKSWLSILAIFPIAVMILSDFSFFPIRMDNGFILAFMFIFMYVGNLLVNYYFDNYLKNKVGVEQSTLDEMIKDNKQSLSNYACMAAVFLTYVVYMIYNMFNMNQFPLDNLLPYRIETYGILALVLLFFYNGNKGYSNKIINYSFYLYYPLHILIMYCIYLLIH